MNESEEIENDKGGGRGRAVEGERMEKRKREGKIRKRKR